MCTNRGLIHIQSCIVDRRILLQFNRLLCVFMLAVVAVAPKALHSQTDSIQLEIFVGGGRQVIK